MKVLQRDNIFFISVVSFFALRTIPISGGKGSLVWAHPEEDLINLEAKKLFVFGDSYSDTGNNNNQASSWKYPYGITFPGNPTGRYSDGRVLTDFLARFIGVRSPVPYRWRNVVPPDELTHGMNFAHGGTGVFETLTPEANMTAQINFFQLLISDSVYRPLDLRSSVALVTFAGNDYGAYASRNGTEEDLPAFIGSVVNQLYLNLKRIHELGVEKIAVTDLEPLGCLPSSTAANAFQKCNETLNTLMNLHNILLQQAVDKLNNGTQDAPFVILDLYESFMSVLNNKADQPGSMKFDNPLTPCCVAASSEYFCGSVEESGEKMYTICENPESAFFWDSAHPTQQGWKSVYLALQDSLHKLVERKDIEFMTQ